MAGLLEGKKVLGTGVLDRRSIAYSAARLAAEQGAEVVLSSFGRARSLTERTAKRLDPPPPPPHPDVTHPADLEAAARARSSAPSPAPAASPRGPPNASTPSPPSSSSTSTSRRT